jgi:membrane metallo-endopeptidase-like protein 1
LRGFEDETVQHYYTYMVKSAVLLGADLDFANEELKESLLFEIDLANITVPSEERRNATALYNPTTLGALPSLEGLPPSWTEYVQKLFEEADQIKIDESEKVIILNLDYFDKLSKLLKQTKPRVLANYLGWQAVKTVMSYLNKAAQKIDQEYDKVFFKKFDY